MGGDGRRVILTRKRSSGLVERLARDLRSLPLTSLVCRLGELQKPGGCSGLRVAAGQIQLQLHPVPGQSDPVIHTLATSGDCCNGAIWGYS